jgi:hypothetical protein
MRELTAGPRRPFGAMLFGAWGCLLIAVGIGGCGGGGGNGGPGEPIALSVTPARAGLVVAQTMRVTATVANDPAAAGVRWSANDGSFSASTSAAGASVTYIAPTTAGVVSITATSITDASKSFTVTVGVTDLPGVPTYHNDVARTGANVQEYALTPALVSAATFGKLFSCTVDGAIYAQPLWVPQLKVGGQSRNVVFVATQHESVYAFDADANTTPCVPLWQASLVDAAHGATPGETSVPFSSGLLGQGLGDIVPEVGITSTPVIDLATRTLYVVAKSVDGANRLFQRLHALDLATGAEKLNGNLPMLIEASVPGTGAGAANGVIAFDPQTQGQRAGLGLRDGIVYVAWTSHEDFGTWHGWIMGFDATTLARKSIFNVTPGGGEGSIWMSGGAPAFDATSLYALTANGTYDGITNFSDSFIKLSLAAGLTIQDWFTPSDQARLASADLDLGSGGVVLIDPATGPVRHLVVGGGKAGSGSYGEIYVLDRDRMGGYTQADSGAVQKFALNNAIYGTPAFWNDTLYIAGASGPLTAFHFDAQSGLFDVAAPLRSANVFGYPGATPTTSARGNANGIVWVIDTSRRCGPASSPGTCGPAVLHAYDAANPVVDLWNSAQSLADAAGIAVKFSVPTVANGKVYVGTHGDRVGILPASKPGQLDVYGLRPN